jgi:uncharacterized protein (UPF0332 family)
MDKEYFNILAQVRLERAEELLKESEDLLENGSFKSANNRAFYAIEKCVKALLATRQLDVATHSGALKQFNFLFIYKGNGQFTSKDYQIIARADQIRNASDYDDFYIASKEECRQQVENARYFLDKVKAYLHTEM